MPGSFGIFAKSRLKPGQLRSIAERRYADARCLLDSGKVERTNGAMYMAGFAIERLLKASLLERHLNLSSAVDPASLSPSDHTVYRLLYSHDLDDMLGFLPEIEEKLLGVRIANGALAWDAFRTICEQWTVYARYATTTAKRSDAAEFLDTVGEVKKRLKDL